MTTAQRVRRRVNGFELSDMSAVWGEGAGFHLAECSWASPEPHTGTFADAVRQFRRPCLTCWRTVSTPSQLMRVSMAILRDEYQAEPFPDEVERVMWSEDSEQEATA